MIRTWQDNDKNIRPEQRGKWFGSRSVDGHIMQITGPYETEPECRSTLIREVLTGRDGIGG